MIYQLKNFGLGPCFEPLGLPPSLRKGGFLSDRESFVEISAKLLRSTSSSSFCRRGRHFFLHSIGGPSFFFKSPEKLKPPPMPINNENLNSLMVIGSDMVMMAMIYVLINLLTFSTNFSTHTGAPGCCLFTAAG